MIALGIGKYILNMTHCLYYNSIPWHVFSFLFPLQMMDLRDGWAHAYPVSRKPGLLGNFPLHRRASPSLKVQGNWRSGDGAAEFPWLWGWPRPSSLQTSPPGALFLGPECSEPRSYLADGDTGDQSVVPVHIAITDEVLGRGKSAGLGGSLEFK